mmetsp:Transcript_16429/g.42567  ORF Transcript_16429/g.42567 Transcript_16429/m.42567 type:complete len:83 (-) Transcript_16429:215-463(-)
MSMWTPSSKAAEHLGEADVFHVQEGVNMWAIGTAFQGFFVEARFEDGAGAKTDIEWLCTHGKLGAAVSQHHGCSWREGQQLA